MNSLKFRIWQPKRKEFHYWGFIDKGHGLVFVGPINNYSGWGMEDYQKASEQYTGKLDRCGTKLWVGDTVQSFINSKTNPKIGQVVYGGSYEYAAFGLQFKRRKGDVGPDPTWDFLSDEWSKYVEKIGNIHEGENDQTYTL